MDPSLPIKAVSLQARIRSLSTRGPAVVVGPSGVLASTFYSESAAWPEGDSKIADRMMTPRRTGCPQEEPGGGGLEEQADRQTGRQADFRHKESRNS
eukprot:760993-Hanusia_phi.AAC.1